MRISDWSSDVCSSDLNHPRRTGLARRAREAFPHDRRRDLRRTSRHDRHQKRPRRIAMKPALFLTPLLGLAACTPAAPDPRDRKSAREGKSVSVRVDTECGRIIKKKKT